MKTKVTIRSANIRCATTDGRVLQLTGTVQALMSFSIAVGYDQGEEVDYDDEDMIPWTILATHFEFPDSDGHCWRITSRFGPEFLIRSMMDFSSMEQLGIWDELDSKTKKKFNKHIVAKDISFSSDDRFIRPLIVGTEIKNIQFKYFFTSFDLAVIPDEIVDNLHIPQVHARTTTPILDYEANELPSLYFPIRWQHFLVNTYSMENGTSDIPIPFIAEPTSQTADPQQSVTLIEAS
jgi:hypothetical protein